MFESGLEKSIGRKLTLIFAVAGARVRGEVGKGA
jgi:hypothetical protein